MVVRVDLIVSLDGCATTTDGTPEDPIGKDWWRLVAPYIATRTAGERVFHETGGKGTTGIDERYAAQYFAEVGAQIIGAGMCGLHRHADDPEWRGWWSDEPPFGFPVFVLTHAERAPLESGYSVTTETAESDAVHLTFER